MDDKYNQQHKAKKKKETQWAPHKGPQGYDPNDAVPYMPREWHKKQTKEKPKDYEWNPQLQALEDILWAS